MNGLLGSQAQPDLPTPPPGTTSLMREAIDGLQLPKQQPTSMRPQIEEIINDVVDKYWNGDSDFKKLLIETAAHEAHFGEMDTTNPMRVVPTQLEEFGKSKYTPQLGAMGVKRTEDGEFDLSDLRTNILLGAMTYVTKENNMNVATTQKSRYDQYKELYNTEEGAATWEAYKTSLRKFNLLEE